MVSVSDGETQRYEVALCGESHTFHGNGRTKKLAKVQVAQTALSELHGVECTAIAAATEYYLVSVFQA